VGCPPDPIEIDYLRGKGELREISSRYSAFQQQYSELISLYRQFQNSAGIRIPFELDSEIRPLLEPTGDVNTLSRVASTFSEMHHCITENKQSLKILENKLCMLRDHILRECRERGIEDQLKTALDKQEQLHMEHRLDDRKTWLSWLHEKEKTYQMRVEFGEKKKKHRFIQKLEKVRKEIERVNSIPVKEIIRNRDLFGHNPNEFE
jgi:hypothetical protein